MAELDDVVVKQPQHHQLDRDGEDEITMKFLDSLDNYMRLIDSLSSSLGQGWFQLASARYSMGASRINGALLNLKPHDAVTQLQTTYGQDQPQFTLCKWLPSEDENSGEIAEEDGKTCTRQEDSDGDATSPHPEPQAKSLPENLPTVDAQRQVQRGRMKSLAVFGALIPPKLRESQLSFEKGELIHESCCLFVFHSKFNLGIEGMFCRHPALPVPCLYLYMRDTGYGDDDDDDDDFWN